MRAFNPQVFLEFLCYSVFSGLVFYITYSGKYLTYVTPRMEGYLYFTAALLLIWAIVTTFRLFKPQNRIRVAHCLVMAIPAMLLLLPLSQLSTAELSYSYSSSNTPTATKSEFSPVVADGILEISNDEFYPWLSEIYSNIDTYVGNEIKMTGFVYKASENDKFILVRLGMSCCVADLVPYGLMCTYSNAEELNPDDWIVISGTLQKNENGEPLISIKSVTPTDPVEGYVYTI